MSFSVCLWTRSDAVTPASLRVDDNMFTGELPEFLPPTLSEYRVQLSFSGWMTDCCFGEQDGPIFRIISFGDKSQARMRTLRLLVSILMFVRVFGTGSQPVNRGTPRWYLENESMYGNTFGLCCLLSTPPHSLFSCA